MRIISFGQFSNINSNISSYIDPCHVFTNSFAVKFSKFASNKSTNSKSNIFSVASEYYSFRCTDIRTD